MVKKNILIVTGSPRNNGNCDRMAEAFLKGALSAQHNVTIFNAGRKEISSCKACNKCWSNGKPCIYQDGFNELAPLLESADVIVFATPLYWFSFPAQIKTAIDKMYAYLCDRSKQPLKIKESILLVCGADDDPGIFDGIKASYEQIAHCMKWEDKGILAVTKVSEIGDIDKTDALERAERLGKSL